MRCEEFRALAGEQALGELDAERSRQAQRHLADCEACREIAGREEQAENELKRVLATRKPAGLDSRMMHAVNERRARVPVTRWERLTAFFGTMVLLLAGLLGMEERTSLFSASWDIPRFSLESPVMDTVLRLPAMPWLGWLVAFLVAVQIAGVAGLLLSARRRVA